MKIKPFPTQLRLVNCSPTLIGIGWDNITHLDLSDISTSECLQLLRLALALEYCVLEPWDEPMLRFDTTILHLRLRSLYFLYGGESFLEAITVPSLEEWTQTSVASNDSLPVTTMVSLLERSGCYLKILKLEDVPLDTNFCVLLQAIPSLEHLRLNVLQSRSHNGEMDDIFARIFRSPLVPVPFHRKNPLANCFSLAFSLWNVQEGTPFFHYFLGITYHNSIVRAIGAR